MAACKPDFDVTAVPDHKHLAIILLGRGVLSQGSPEWGDGAESPLVAVLRKIFILILSAAEELLVVVLSSSAARAPLRGCSNQELR